MRFFTSVLLFPLVMSCANVRAPGGGPKDTTAPKVLQEIPANASVNFQSSGIFLAFDEYVQLTDARRRIIVNPPLAGKPDIKLKKNKYLQITFSAELEKNTTYSVNFGSAISDLNEGNVLQNYVYVFSTGDQLDSLYVKGALRDAYTNEKLSGVRVMLYDGENDSLPFVSDPNYFCSSQKDGAFNLSFLPERGFKLFALADENENFRYDEGEAMAFLDERIWPEADDSLSDAITLRLSREIPKNQYITEKSVDSTGFLCMHLFGPVKDVVFRPLINEAISFKSQVSGDSLCFWFLSDPINRSIPFEFIEDGQVLDTLELPNYAVSDDYFEDRSLQVSLTTRSFDAQQRPFLTLDRVPDVVDMGRVLLTRDSTELPVFFGRGEDISAFQLSVDGPWEDGGQYKLLLLPGAIQSLEGLGHDTLHFDIGCYPSDYFGSMRLKILGIPPGQAAFLEILDDRKQLISKTNISGESDLLFARMLPGRKKMRLVIEEVVNGEWDPVDYAKKRQPEEVYSFPEELLIRSNWDIEISWQLNP